MGDIPGVHDIKLEHREPCEKASVNAWEQRHSCIMPFDLKNFYLSTDGFHMTWSYMIGGESVSIGTLQINPLAKLQRIAGLSSATVDSDGYPTLLDLDLLIPKNHQEIPLFKSTCKIFCLDSCGNMATVCLVYVECKLNPSIWLLDRSLEWHFLASSFTQYFRMMLVYHGLPEWQLKLTPMGLAPWAEQIVYSFMPHLNSPTFLRKNFINYESQLDSSIFKVRTKHTRKSKTAEFNEQHESAKKLQ
ncbi:tubulin polyglutamylase complex subunit 2-like isoform X2 [Cimex lectularius]|uniref:Knr4/Smi1-like domain-containing protein n=1 Tax=Cimex lectularius TaxID=79782 RepID=A0A8I6S4Y7_CIMLE|nr:tubulin polyglutamylase complex subunit 2-like isoform X2 [Cimex lectularius]